MILQKIDSCRLSAYVKILNEALHPKLAPEERLLISIRKNTQGNGSNPWPQTCKTSALFTRLHLQIYASFYEDRNPFLYGWYRMKHGCVQDGDQYN